MLPGRDGDEHPSRHGSDGGSHRPPDSWSRFAGVRGGDAVGTEWRTAAAQVRAALADWRASTDALLAAMRRGDAPGTVSSLEESCNERRAALDRAVAAQRAARNRVLDRLLRPRQHSATGTDPGLAGGSTDPRGGDGRTGMAHRRRG